MEDTVRNMAGLLEKKCDEERLSPGAVPRSESPLSELASKETNLTDMLEKKAAGFEPA
jgi:hypothetical protein